MSKKYYKVLKDNFLWKTGAILEGESSYRPLDQSDIWDFTEYNGSEYISAQVIENNPEWFVKVYPVNLLTKTVYKVKAEAMELITKDYTGG